MTVFKLNNLNLPNHFLAQTNGNLPSTPSSNTKQKDIPGTWTWNEVEWHYIAFYIWMHVLGGYGLIVTVMGLVKWQTVVSAYVEVILGTLGILAGAHRLWAHRSYKATFSLR